MGNFWKVVGLGLIPGLALGGGAYYAVDKYLVEPKKVEQEQEATQTSEEQITSLQEELEKVLSENESIKAQIQTLTTSNAQKDEQLTQLQSQLTELQEQGSEDATTISNLTEQISTLQTEKTQNQQTIESLQSTVAQNQTTIANLQSQITELEQNSVEYNMYEFTQVNIHTNDNYYLMTSTRNEEYLSMDYNWLASLQDNCEVLEVRTGKMHTFSIGDAYATAETEAIGYTPASIYNYSLKLYDKDNLPINDVYELSSLYSANFFCHVSISFENDDEQYNFSNVVLNIKLENVSIAGEFPEIIPIE